MPTLLETGRREPPGPIIVMASGVEAIIRSKQIPKHQIEAKLIDWWHSHLRMGTPRLAGGRPVRAASICAALAVTSAEIEYSLSVGHGAVHFSCDPGRHGGATFYVQGELTSFLSQLRPTLYVDHLTFVSTHDIPCSIYLSHPSKSQIAKARSFIERFSKSLEAEIVEMPPAQNGSWWQRLLMRFSPKLHFLTSL